MARDLQKNVPMTAAARLAAAGACALLLASCGEQDNDPGPGGVTVGEARALDEAAEMIEQGRPSPELLKGVAAPVKGAPDSSATEQTPG